MDHPGEASTYSLCVHGKPARRPSRLRGLTVWSLAVLLMISGSPLLAKSAKKQHEEVLEATPLYDNDELAAYIDRIGHRLAAVSDAPDINYTFSLIDSPMVNAFAAKGGYIYITRGILAFLNSEDELAAVIGHEIGHVALDHHGRRKSQQALSNVGSVLATIFTGSYDLGETVRLYGQEAISGYGRDMELEADDAGARYLAHAGYDPYAMVEVIQVLKDQEGFARKVQGAPPTYHGVFASHPKNDRRLQKIVGDAMEMAGDELGEPEGDFFALINGLAFGNPSAEGVSEGRTYYHSNLGFIVDFPEEWTIQDSPSRVAAYPAGKANETYISLTGQANEGHEKISTFIKKGLKLEDIEDGEEVEINGMRGYLTKMKDPGNFQVRLIGVVMKDNTGYTFKGATRDPGRVDALRTEFRETVESFRRMTRDDIKEAPVTRVKVVVAKPGDSYDGLAHETSLERDAAEQLRLINGDFPVGEPRAGDYIKIVQ